MCSKISVLVLFTLALHRAVLLSDKENNGHCEDGKRHWQTQRKIKLASTARAPKPYLSSGFRAEILYADYILIYTIYITYIYIKLTKNCFHAQRCKNKLTFLISPRLIFLPSEMFVSTYRKHEELTKRGL